RLAPDCCSQDTERQRSYHQPRNALAGGEQIPHIIQVVPDAHVASLYLSMSAHCFSRRACTSGFPNTPGSQWRSAEHTSELHSLPTRRSSDLTAGTRLL